MPRDAGKNKKFGGWYAPRKKKTIYNDPLLQTPIIKRRGRKK